MNPLRQADNARQVTRYNRTVIAFEDKMREGGARAPEEAERFFMKDDAVHKTLRSMAARLDELRIDYAVVGGMALVAHGYERTTVDVDILLTSEGNRRVREHLDGRGYVPPLAGSRNLRDTQTGATIKFLIAGEFPGDGKPKPVAFPDPAGVAVEIDGIRYLRLEKMIEPKLASGMTNPNRLKDLADVQELIRTLRPPRMLGENLDEFVRGRFFELWDGLQSEWT